MKNKLIIIYFILFILKVNTIQGQVYIQVDTNLITTPITDTLGYIPGSNKQIKYTTPPNYTLDSMYVNNQYNSSYTRDSINGFSFTNIIQKNYLRVVYSFINYTINASSNTGGTISPIGTTIIGVGDSLRYTINPNTGYIIDSLIINDTPKNISNFYTFKNINSNQKIRVFFKIKTFNINATAGNGGTISPTGAIIVNYGNNVNFTFLPNLGYVIDSLIVNGIKITNANSYHFDSVKSNQTIRVAFKIQTTCPTNKTPIITRVSNNLTTDIPSLSLSPINYNKQVWYESGTQIAATLNNMFSPINIGIYTVIGFDSANNCATNLSKKYYYATTCITPTGRIGNGASIEGNVIDNPSQIVIKWCPEILKNFITILALDINGNKVLEQKVPANLGTYILFKNTINATQYFIQVLDENNELVQLSDVIKSNF